MSASINALRPAQGPQRFGGGATTLSGPQLPAYALQVPRPANPLVSPPPVPPVPQAPTGPVSEPTRSPYGIEHEVSTRLPTVRVSRDPHSHAESRVDLASWMPNLDDPNTDPEHIRKWNEAWGTGKPGVRSIREHYPHINTTGLSHHEAAQAMVGHMHDNIVHLVNEVKDRPWFNDAVHWYWGANRYAHDLASKYTNDVKGGLSHRQAAAAIAALSPQTDWNQNVNRVERMLDIMKNHKETEFSPEMHKFVHDQMMNRKNDKMRQKGLDQLAGLSVGTKFKDISEPLHQAFFARAYDELHNRDRSYPIISPTGEKFAHPPLAGTGQPPRMGWGSFDELHNAFKALKSDDLRNISRSLGDMHKVRSFYNNIIAPDSPNGHVTIDTHAINAGQIMPMGSKHEYVTHGLGSGLPFSGVTGSHGLYPLYAEAYRRAAHTLSQQHGRRYLPREIQSVAWEAIKGMFDQAEHKDVHPPFLDREKTVPNPRRGEPAHPVGEAAKHGWTLSRYGIINPGAVRAMVAREAGGISDPQWFQFRQQGLQPMTG